MDDITELYLFCLAERDWFESPQYYRAQPEHLLLVEGHLTPAWRISRSGAWYSATPPGPPGPAQGWKIHVSATTATAVETLDRAVPVLVEESVPFKFAVDGPMLRMMNSGTWPRAGAAKFLTVYPPSTGCFLRLMAALEGALEGLAGPFVLSDRRPGPASVHYRYGGFRPVSRLEPDGRHTLMVEAPDGTREPDHRLPFWYLPEWMSDPLRPGAGPVPVPELADGRYRVQSVMGASTKGGVYRALDLRRGETVVIKEARPHVGHDDAGQDAVAMRRKEHAILQELAGTGIAPLPIDFFFEWEHAFLVEELVPGVPLGPLTTRSNPLYFHRPEELAAYFRWIDAIGDRLEAMLAVLHGRGITYGDLSLLNVMVDERDTGGPPALRFVDFEAAVRQGIDSPTGTVTPGFSSPRAHREHRCSPDDDHFALGRVLFTMMVLSPNVLDLEPRALDRYLQSLRSDIGFPAPLADRIRRLTPSPAWPPTPPAGPEQFEACARSTLDHALAHLDLGRRDRAFPADPRVFLTNPLSVAYGAAGLAHALRTVRGSVPAELRAWMLDQPVSAERYAPSLYHGLAGIGWVLGEMGEVERAEELVRAAAAHPLAGAEPGVIDGAAGIGLALLRLWTLTRREEHLGAAETIGRRLVDGATASTDGLCWPSGDGTIPVGYARGSSGIAVFLLSLAGATGQRGYRDAAESAARFDLSQARDVDGRFTAFSRLAYGSPTDTLRHYWVEGSAGVGTALVRLWSATGDPVYRHALDGIIADCTRTYTAHTGLFSGLAGMANFLIDAYAAIGDADLLARAEQAARGLLLFAVDRPEGTAFPGDQGLRLSCDFATGSAGVALTLHRVAHPDGPNFNFVVDSLLPAPAGLRPLVTA